jgi:hypothetical protein
MKTHSIPKKVLSPRLVALGMTITVAVILLVFFLNFGRGIVTPSGSIISEIRPVGAFDSLDISTAGNVKIIQGEKTSLKISGDSNYLSAIKSEVAAGTLLIFQESILFNLSVLSGIEIEITVADLKSVKSSGAAVISGEVTRPENNRLDLTLSGSGQLDLDINSAEVRTVASGSADIILRGKAERQFLKSSGSGKYLALDLGSQDVTISASGSLEAAVNAERNLAVTISGSGAVAYTGTPKVEQKISGSGKVYSLE